MHAADGIAEAFDPFRQALQTRRCWDPLRRNLKLIRERYRRMASEMANACAARLQALENDGEELVIEGLYFDWHGKVVGVRADDQDFKNGQAVERAGDRRWACVGRVSAELERLAKWAEYIHDDHLYRNGGSRYFKHEPVAPGELNESMPRELAELVERARDSAEEELRERGDV